MKLIFLWLIGTMCLIGCTLNLVAPQRAALRLPSTPANIIPAPINVAPASVVLSTSTTTPWSGTIALNFVAVNGGPISIPGDSRPTNIGQGNLYIDGQPLAVILSQTYSLDTTKLANGPHVLSSAWMSWSPGNIFVCEGVWPFTVSNPNPPMYTGTIPPPAVGPSPFKFFPRDVFLSAGQITATQMVAANVNCVEVNVYTNPQDGGATGGYTGTNLVAWTTISNNTFNNAVAPYTAAGLHVWGLGDQLFNTANEQAFTVSCPWAIQFIQAATANAAAHGLIGISMADEVRLGATPTTNFPAGLMANIMVAINTAAPNMPADWPCAGFDASAKLAAWSPLNSDIDERYWAVSFPAYPNLVNNFQVDSLGNAAAAMIARQAVYAAIPTVRPWGALIQGNTTGPAGLIGQMYVAWNLGACFERLYDWHTVQNTANWQAYTTGNAIFSAHEPFFLQGRVPSPNFGPTFSTGESSGANGTLLCVVNVLDVPQTVTVPLPTNGWTITDYDVTAGTSTNVTGQITEAVAFTANDVHVIIATIPPPTVMIGNTPVSRAAAIEIGNALQAATQPH